MATGIIGPAPIGIIGIGGSGTYAVQFAKALGHSVVAINNRPQGRELAAEAVLPADLIVDYKDPKATDKVKAWAGKDGLAAVIVCTDNIPATEWSLNLLRPHGVCVPVGLPVEGFQFSAFTLIFSELVIKGSLVATRPQVEEIMETVARFGIRHHVTTFTIDEAPNVVEWYMSKDLKGRLVLKMD